MKRTVAAAGLLIVMFGSGCGTRVNEALFAALQSASLTAIDVFVSDLYSDLPNLFTFPPPSGEPGPPGDGDDADADGDSGGGPTSGDNGGGGLAGDPITGEALYGLNGCGLCHCEDGAGECLPGSPGLQGSSLEANRDAVIGDAPHAGGKASDLSEQDLVDIVAYLAEVGGGSGGDSGESRGSAATGEAFYNDNACGVCHCADGSGGCLSSAPGVMGTDLDTVRRILTGEAPHTGGSIADITDQEISDLVAFLAG